MWIRMLSGRIAASRGACVVGEVLEVGGDISAEDAKLFLAMGAAEEAQPPAPEKPEPKPRRRKKKAE